MGTEEVLEAAAFPGLVLAHAQHAQHHLSKNPLFLLFLLSACCCLSAC